MRRILTTIACYFLITNCHAQFSAGFSLGAGEISRKIPIAFEATQMVVSLNVFGERVFPSQNIGVRVSTNIITPYHHEKSYGEYTKEYGLISSRIYADYNNQICLLAGFGFHTDIGNFFHGYGYLETGFLYSEYSHYIDRENGNQPNLSSSYASGIVRQIPVGPLIGISFGKRRLKGYIEYEALFLLGGESQLWFAENFDRLGIGCRWQFFKKSKPNNEQK